MALGQEIEEPWLKDVTWDVLEPIQREAAQGKEEKMNQQ